MKKQYLSTISVFRRPRAGYAAILRAGPLSMACRIGRAGATRRKREGDGKSPLGALRIRRGWWRADRRFPPRTGVAMTPVRRDEGWCDAPGHGRYNRLVRLPFRPSHEEMWRADRQYDVVLELSWNVRPRIQGLGSAIFLHIAPDRLAGTAGCVAVSPDRIDRLMARIGPRTRLVIR